MSEASDAVEQLSGRMDKALATVLATPDAEDRYFIGETLLAAAALYLLNRYAGVYLDRLGFKPLAERLADASQAFLDVLRAKSVTPQQREKQQALLQEAVVAIRTRGAATDAEKLAQETLVNVLVEAGAGRAQARDAAREVAVTISISVRGA